MQAVFSSVGGAEELAPVLPSTATGVGGMDEADHHENTPLLLALQLGRLECANVRRIFFLYAERGLVVLFRDMGEGVLVEVFWFLL